MAEESDLEKTEDPTHRRIEDATKKGQVSFSREITNFLILAFLALQIAWMMPHYGSQATRLLARFLASPEEIHVDTPAAATLLLREVTISVAMLMITPVALVVVLVLLSSILQNGVVISVEPLIPKLEKISPLKGLKRLFSMRSLVEFLKGVLKITVVGVVAYLAVKPEMSRLEGLVTASMAGILQVLGMLALKIAIAAASVMLILAVLDAMYQRFEYLKSLRMTRQEVKEEYKQSEGDPHIKAKLRQIRHERARKRMMAAVPEADVVVRNPEHYAVALKYDQATMRAPVVLAMGQDSMALKIIEVAEEHDVPTVVNRPLARALYEACEIDEEIPLEHYQTVAEVIAYVYRLKKKLQ